jgi:dihydroorotate dehydrogenase
MEEHKADRVKQELRKVARIDGVLYLLWVWLYRTSVYHKIWPFLRLLPAERAHHLGLFLLKLPLRFVRAVPPSPFARAGLNFRNRIGIAAGFDKNGECLAGLERLGAGFVEIGTVLVEEHSGWSEYPRIRRLVPRMALWNRLGFPSRGVTSVGKKLAKFPPGKRSGMILGCNIGPRPKEVARATTTSHFLAIISGELRDLVNELHKHVDYFAINLSSPNTPGLRNVLESPELCEKLLLPLKDLLHQKDSETKPGAKTLLLLKIAPEDSERRPWSKSSLEKVIQSIIGKEACDGFIATNTSALLAREFAPDYGTDERPGGISGAPLRQRAIDTVGQLRKIAGPKYLIIGCGGVMAPQHVLEFLDAGADLVQLYTGLIYNGPSFIKECVRATLAPRTQEMRATRSIFEKMSTPT